MDTTMLKYIDRFIENNIIDYFLVREKKYEIHRVWLAQELCEFIEDNEAQILTMNNEEVASCINREIEKFLYTNDELLQIEEDKEIHNYLLENLKYMYVNNPAKVREDFIAGRIVIDYEG